LLDPKTPLSIIMSCMPLSTLEHFPSRSNFQHCTFPDCRSPLISNSPMALQNTHSLQTATTLSTVTPRYLCAIMGPIPAQNYGIFPLALGQIRREHVIPEFYPTTGKWDCDHLGTSGRTGRWFRGGARGVNGRRRKQGVVLSQSSSFPNQAD
jgi:hypothetical protein